MAVILTDSQEVPAGPVSAVSKAGNPAQIDGAPVWASSDESILTVAASEDGLSAVISTTGAVGSAQVSVKADADLGEGVEEIVGLLEFEVIGGKAASLVVPVGEPTEKA